ncbi:hypothetical protein [Candidatus Electronema sp. TJ]|uniref:hypothetical protein n=1 Tax=Candidatus Electronema sp. TJ TaxID=3401573 RepID=UPI003AA83E23
MRVPKLLRWNAGVLHDPAHHNHKIPSASHVKPLIQAALDHEIHILKIDLEKTIRQLRHFEEQFGKESRLFYEEFQDGILGDDMEYMKCAGEYETFLFLYRSA